MMMDWFWNPKFWLPRGYTWEDMKGHGKGYNIPDSEDFFTYSFVTAFIYLVLKYVLTRLVFIPIGVHYGIENTLCKSAHRGNHKKFEDDDEVRLLSTEKKVVYDIEWNPLQIYSSYQGSTMQRFVDTAWEVACFGLLCVIGLFVLPGKSWFWIRHDWHYGYPLQNVTSDIYWYLIIGLGYYWFQFIYELTAHRKSTTLMTVAHHFATIILLNIMWVTNFFRIGSITLFILHTPSSPLLVAKLFKFCGSETAKNDAYTIGGIVFMFVRLYIFPKWVLYPTIFECPQVMKESYAVYYITNSMLIILYAINIRMSYSIVKKIIKINIVKTVNGRE